MKIKDVCRETGLTDRAVRYYIENGLVFPEKNENYAGRRNFNFTENDVEILKRIGVLRKADFSIEQIKGLFQGQSVANTANERMKELLLEREKCSQLSAVLSQVSKNQELSLQQLVEALENPVVSNGLPSKDEEPPFTLMLLRARRIITGLCVAFCVILLVIVLTFINFGGPSWFKRQWQNSAAVVTVFQNGKLLTAEQYELDVLVGDCKTDVINGERGYMFDIDYGEIKGVVTLENGFQIEFGLINLNNWHNLDFILDIAEDGNNVTVSQRVIYKTGDGVDEVDVLIVEETANPDSGFVSLFSYSDRNL